MEKRTKKRLLIVSGCLVVLVAAAALATHLAARRVESRIVELLGPSGQAARIDVGLSEVVLHDVTIGAPAGWPAEHTLRAKRIVCTPDWRSLVSHRLVIHRLAIEDYYLSVRRSSKGIEVLPTLTAQAREKRRQSAAEGKDASERWETEIGSATLQDGQLDYYDAVVAKPPHRIAFDQLQAQIGPLHFPKRAEHTNIKVSGRTMGKSHSGTVAVDGWLAAASGDADVHTRLAQVDVSVLAPYLYHGSAAVLAGGVVGLDMRTRIVQRQLNAAGRLELRDLKFGGNGDRLLSLPRKAVIAALEDRNGKVAFDFTLTGNLDDPKFSLDDSISMRVIGGLGQAIGISAKGVAEGVGGAVQELGNALSDLVEQK
ncbi:DUF748 domain-containing protein [Bordetella sp. BOR01]|uniref:DUF748 domain-containing protein n=1 Tax=Bordetella sp. BOR01 TaxID=2854779 RepID=UPI001C455EEB|nr:DUF748 domain-containing protein [Bordetella sp. BOR01]MBV7481413.1 DUF748 domain-containing protein [Bordetella sp. BOR01]